ncbi:MAG: hypothetical protein WBI55_09305 [Eubacteriales bacterium]|jgi:hypothetical protein
MKGRLQDDGFYRFGVVIFASVGGTIHLNKNNAERFVYEKEVD